MSEAVLQGLLDGTIVARIELVEAVENAVDMFEFFADKN